MMMQDNWLTRYLLQHCYMCTDVNGCETEEKVAACAWKMTEMDMNTNQEWTTEELLRLYAY